MRIDEKMAKAIANHKDDINNGDFVSVILETYLQCGAKGVGELKDIFFNADIDMKLYNDAIEKIIKVLLKNSDLWNPDSKYSIWNRQQRENNLGINVEKRVPSQVRAFLYNREKLINQLFAGDG